MNARIAKAIRRKVYGDMVFSKNRKYKETNVKSHRIEVSDKKASKLEKLFEVVKMGIKNIISFKTYTIISDPMRTAYREAKRDYYGIEWSHVNQAMRQFYNKNVKTR